MSEFGKWCQWGVRLTDTQFANAFTALGLLASPPDRNPHGRSFSKSSEPNSTPGDALIAEIRNLISDAGRKNWILDWRYPHPEKRVEILDQRIALQELDPFLVAEAWEASGLPDHEPLRLRVLEYPNHEPIRPWRRLLSESAFQKSVFFTSPNPRAPLRLTSPLQLAYLARDTEKPFFDNPYSRSLPNPQEMIGGLDKAQTDCAFLYYSGSMASLIEDLRALPAPKKIGLVILHHDLEYAPPFYLFNIAMLTRTHQAGGFIILSPRFTFEDCMKSLLALQEPFSQSFTLDRALRAAFETKEDKDVILFLSPRAVDYKSTGLGAKENIGPQPRRRPRLKRQVLERSKIKKRGQQESPAGMERASEPSIEMIDSLGSITGLFRLHRSTIVREPTDDAFESSRFCGAEAPMVEAESEETSQPKIIPSPRFLQQQVRVRKSRRFVREYQALYSGIPTRIHIRIGPIDRGWSHFDAPAPGPFPVEELPPDMVRWELTVVLSDPVHLLQPLRDIIVLPRIGASSTCEFNFTPGSQAIFEGQVTVLFRGRILQTGVLRAEVLAKNQAPAKETRIAFEQIVQIRMRMDDLESRRPFDTAFLESKGSDDQPHLTAFSTSKAWVKNPPRGQSMMTEISGELNRVANSVADYQGGLTTKANQDLLRGLALRGRWLYDFIVTDQIPETSSALMKSEFLQVVSALPGAMVPFEFIYDYEPPDEKAELCPRWRAALQEISDSKPGCWSGCRQDPARICPIGFWGIRKVIERHKLTPGSTELEGDNLLQIDPSGERPILSLRGAAVVGASNRVSDAELRPILKACQESLGSKAEKAKSWEQWEALVQEKAPTFLLVLPHTSGIGSAAALEIGGKTILSIRIRSTFIRAEKAPTPPLVALLGCDTSATAQEYESHVDVFRRRGAAIVIGTIATVYGKHAAKVAELLVRGLQMERNPEERLGEIIRSIKCQGLLSGMVMPLCLVAYGDADWVLN